MMTMVGLDLVGLVDTLGIDAAEAGAEDRGFRFPAKTLIFLSDVAVVVVAVVRL